MVTPSEPRASGVRDALLQVMRADLEADRVRSAAEYRALYPGHEGEISALLALLEDGPVGGGRVAPDGAGAPAAPDERGERVGPYRIVDEIGRGGQAIVYLAEHVELARRVALKVLQRGAIELQASADRHRFRREAEVTSRLDHFGICSVYEAGEDGGQAWIAMRHVPGETLAAHLERCHERGEPPPSGVVPLPAPSESGDRTPPGTQRQRPPAPPPQAGDRLMRVVALIEKVARALHFAHERGLVHRDVKPANIMVDPGGEPVLLDFGMAKDETAGGATLTIKGDLIGTPYYMSPEQLLAQRVPLDRRTDVYSLGATLYECLTLRRPYEATSREALYQQILAGDLPDPRGLNSRVPRDLALVLQTALDRDRDRRYQTALDLAEDLRRVRTHELIRARPLPRLLRVRRWGQRHPAASTALAVVSVSLCVAIWLVAERSARVRQLRAWNLVAQSQRMLTEDPDLAMHLALRAVDLEDSVMTRAQVRHVAREPFPVLTLTLPDGVEASWTKASWSADGSRLRAVGRTVQGGQLGGRCYAAWDRSGGLTTLVQRPEAGLFGWWPEMDTFVHGTPERIEFLDGEGNVLNLVPRTELELVIRAGAVWLLIHHDGSCEARSDSGERVAAVEPFDSKVIGLREGRSRREFVVATNAGTLELRDAAGKLVRRCRLDQEPGEAEAPGRDGGGWPQETRMAFSEETRRAALRLANGGVLLWDVDGGRTWPLATAEPCRQVHFSPSGHRLLTIHDDASRLWTGDGEPVAKLVPPGTFGRKPQGRWYRDGFSPRGDRVVTLYDGPSVALWDQDGRFVRWLDVDLGSGMGGVRYADGDDLLLCLNGGRVQVFDFGGRRVQQFFPYRRRGAMGGAEIAVSPDGGEVLVVTSRDSQGQASVWSLRNVSSRRFVHSAAIRGMAVAVDGRIATGSDDGTVRICTAEGTLIDTVRSEGAGVQSVAFSPEGAILAFGDRAGRIRRWDTRARQELPPLQGGKDLVARLAFSTDGSLLASGCRGGGVWRCQDGQPLGSSLEFWATSARLSRDGQQLYAAGPAAGRHGVHVLAVPLAPRGDSSPPPSELIPGSGSDVFCLDVRLASDDSLLAASYADGAIRFWRRAAKWTLAWERRKHQREICSVAFSPDGQRMVSASRDGTARIWSLDGNTLAILRGRGAPLRAAEFTPDGTHVLTADEDGVVERFLADDDEMLRQARSIQLRELNEDDVREFAELLGR